MKKRYLLAIITVFIMSFLPFMSHGEISTSTTTVQAQSVGWQKVNGTWYYYNASGVKQTGWLKEGSTWYYLKSSGAMATGWENVNDTWYYLDSSGAMKTGWLKEGSTWYYLKPSGAMATGWEKVNGTWYYLEQSGAMKTGWLKEGNTWYYLKSNGAMATGWEKVNGTWYYLEQSGAMKTGWLKEGSTWYYLKPSGAMAIGWEKVNNVWYYFYNSGAMATNTTIDGFIPYVEQLIFDKVNQEREKAGVAPLEDNSLMNQYARTKSKDMGDRQYFSHENPEGDLVIDFMKQDGVQYQAWGENIAYMSGYISESLEEIARQFMLGWMNSNGHRENILSTNFTSLGIGVYRVGNEIYATQEFYR